MATISIPKKKVAKKRKAGMRAGLTKQEIAIAAAALIEELGADNFSLRKLAKAFGVVPTTIHAHFPGGIGAVLAAVARLALTGVSRPFKPNENPGDYLRELLLNILLVLHSRPVVAKLVVLQLAANPVLDPLLAERLLSVLTGLDVTAEARPRAFQRMMGILFEMILLESARSSAAAQQEVAATLAKTAAGLSLTEFSNLVEQAKGLELEAIRPSSTKPSSELAVGYATRIIECITAK